MASAKPKKTNGAREPRNHFNLDRSARPDRVDPAAQLVAGPAQRLVIVVAFGRDLTWLSGTHPFILSGAAAS